MRERKKKEAVMICPSCKGTGKMKIIVYEGGKKNECKIGCIDCNKTGEVDEAAWKARKKAEKEFWCSCGNPSGDAHYYEHGGSHGWNCADCGKVIQVG